SPTPDSDCICRFMIHVEYFTTATVRPSLTRYSADKKYLIAKSDQAYLKRFRYRFERRKRVKTKSLDRNLPADLDDLVARQAEEVADMDRVALHHRKELLLPARQAHAILAVDHGFVADIISDVVEIDGAAERSAHRKQLRNMRPLHEAELRFRAPEIRHDLLQHDAPAGRDPGHREHFHPQHEQVLVQRTVMLDMPSHHRRDTAFGPRQEHRRAGHARNVLFLDP